MPESARRLSYVRGRARIVFQSRDKEMWVATCDQCFWLSVFGLLSNSSSSLAANVCCPPLYEFSIFTFSSLQGLIELRSDSLETYI